MPKFLTANRVAAITTWLTGLAAFITAIEQTLPGKYANAIVGAAGLATAGATALHYMTGSQKFDALQANASADDVPVDATFDDQVDATIWRDSAVTPDGDGQAVDVPPPPPASAPPPPPTPEPKATK